MPANIGKLIIITGIILVILGLIIWKMGDKFGWFGNLPGDVKIESENIRIYAPLASMLIISIILTVLIWIIRKILS